MSIDQANDQAHTIAAALNKANVSLRLALGRINEVTDRMPEYNRGLRGITERGIDMMRAGDSEDRYSRISGAQSAAMDLSDDIRRGSADLEEAHDELRTGLTAIEVADEGLTRLQRVPGHDEQLVQTLTERANLLRGAAGQAMAEVGFAGAKLEAVRDNLKALNSEGYLQSRMDPAALAANTTQAGMDATRELSMAETEIARGTGRLETVRMPADAAEHDSARLAAQKGLNPTAAADQRAAAAGGQGAEDLRSRMAARLDGADRGRE